MNSEKNTNDVKKKQTFSFFYRIKNYWLFGGNAKHLTLNQKSLYYLFNIFFVLSGLVVLGLCSLLLAYGASYPHSIFLGYLNNPYILFLNLFPPVLLFAFLYGLFRRIWLSYFFDGALVLGFSLANFYLLRFRDDPLMFSDILYLKEAVGISYTQDYDYSLTKRIVVCFSVFFIITLFFYLFCRLKPKFVTGVGFVFASIVLCFCFRGFYFDEHIYDIKTQNNDNINRWSQTQVYISKGFVYPFIHSINDVFVKAPAGYDELDAKNTLALYETYNIPEDKKVNVISIMLEAFCDLETIGVTGIDESVYADYRKIRDDNLHGTLVTNIFAGGTVDSERAFLTGYHKLDNYRKPVDSYVRYFNSQGYYTDGSHPSQDWFYNRKNVNKYLGFCDYRFSENYFYEKYGDNMRLDSVAFNEFFGSYKDAQKNGNTPYFAFHVTYQGHGPYSANSHEWGNGTYYNNPDISAESNYILDNYFGSVKDTSSHILKLYEQIKNEKEPVVLLLFGDHKPWLGDSNSVYNELGINIDVSTKEGFLNYYSTEYIIAANDAAKKLLSNDFKGEGPLTSTNFLMSVLFDELGFAGNDYMCYSRNVREKLCALNSVGAFDNQGNFYTLGEMPPVFADAYNSYQSVSFYRSIVEVDNP